MEDNGSCCLQGLNQSRNHEVPEVDLQIMPIITSMFAVCQVLEEVLSATLSYLMLTETLGVSVLFRVLSLKLNYDMSNQGACLQGICYISIRGLKEKYKC